VSGEPINVEAPSGATEFSSQTAGFLDDFLSYCDQRMDGLFPALFPLSH
jgi:hypothetical protein